MARYRMTSLNPGDKAGWPPKPADVSGVKMPATTRAVFVGADLDALMPDGRQMPDYVYKKLFEQAAADFIADLKVQRSKQ